VFIRRTRLSWRLRWLLFGGVVVLFLAGFSFLFWLTGTIPAIKANPGYRWWITFPLAAFVGYISNICTDWLQQSTVTLKSYQPEESWFKRNRDPIVLTAITAVITAVLTAIITTFINKGLPSK
jgi:predicted permease